MKTQKDITIILDRSGSMESIKSATIEGFNSFLRDQKVDEVTSAISLMQFDDSFETVYEEIDAKFVKELNNNSFVPRGTTALLDAIGRTIKLTKNRIKLKKQSNQPEHIVIAIITDGGENSSTKFTREKVFQQIRKREEKDNWTFVFIAANQDAIYEASKYGINANRALTFSADRKGVQSAFSSFSKRVYCMSEPDGFTFDMNDRKDQERK